MVNDKPPIKEANYGFITLLWSFLKTNKVLDSLQSINRNDFESDEPEHVPITLPFLLLQASFLIHHLKDWSQLIPFAFSFDFWMRLDAPTGLYCIRS